MQWKKLISRVIIPGSLLLNLGLQGCIYRTFVKSTITDYKCEPTDSQYAQERYKLSFRIEERFSDDSVNILWSDRYGYSRYYATMKACTAEGEHLKNEEIELVKRDKNTYDIKTK